MHTAYDAHVVVQQLRITFLIAVCVTSADLLCRIVDDTMNRFTAKSEADDLRMTELPEKTDRVRPAWRHTLREDVHNVPAISLDIRVDLVFRRVHTCMIPAVVAVAARSRCLMRSLQKLRFLTCMALDLFEQDHERSKLSLFSFL